jgi:hypothetical protein
MSKKKRPKKYNPNTTNTPETKKNMSRKSSSLSRVKKNWPVWVLSLLMACSLLGRFAARTSRPVPRTGTGAPPVTTPAATVTNNEIFTGQLTVQAGSEPAKTYEYQLSLPKDWHGKYETQVQDNVVSFIYDLSPTSKITLFTLAAYPEQQWQQLQTEPGFHGEKLLAKDGVVFVDTVVLNDSSAANTPQELQSINNEIPKIIHSFEARSI